MNGREPSTKGSRGEWQAESHKEDLFVMAENSDGEIQTLGVLKRINKTSKRLTRGFVRVTASLGLLKCRGPCIVICQLHQARMIESSRNSTHGEVGGTSAPHMLV